MTTPQDYLKHYFGYNSFRPYQEEIICNTLEGRDSIVLMPTGGGKSVCFQIPALMMEGTAIVISPLIALMKDQVEGLIENGISAAFLNSSQKASESERVKIEILSGQIKLLYVSPERFLGELDSLFSRLRFSFIAIDEAHCISQWGHDFRPEYTQLGMIKDRFPQLPIIALTATADKITREDIRTQLKLENAQLFLSSFNRPNLSLSVVSGATKKVKLKMITDFISKRKDQSGIIYCMKRDTVEQVAEELNLKGISAAPYHAGMNAKRRDEVQTAFINDSIDVIVATIAFGMGIDKSNVRWVIHYNLPKSMENYYQEIGRSGRDGLPADTFLFYSVGDLILLRSFAEESGQQEINSMKLKRMQEFAESGICRRKILMSYFGETLEEDCGNCDVCKNPPERFNGTVLVQKALSAIKRTDEKIGFRMLVDILRGSSRAELFQEGYHMLKTYGVGKEISYQEWSAYFLQMLQLNCMEVAYNEGSVVKITPFGEEVLYGRKEVFLYKPRPYEPAGKGKKGGKKTAASPIASQSPEEDLYDQLRALRKVIAQEKGVPAYLIFSDKVLTEMANQKPMDRKSFGEISGVGIVKSDMYADRFTRLIRTVLERR